MSVVNQFRSNNTQSLRKQPAERPAREKSDFWLNVGVNIEVVNQAGETETVFISLPKGIPLDDMKPVPVRGSNQDWIDMAQTKNRLLAEIQKAAANLAPGERLDIGEMTVQVYRTADPIESTPADDAENPLMASLLSTLGAKQAA